MNAYPFIIATAGILFFYLLQGMALVSANLIFRAIQALHSLWRRQIFNRNRPLEVRLRRMKTPPQNLIDAGQMLLSDLAVIASLRHIAWWRHA